MKLAGDELSKCIKIKLYSASSTTNKRCLLCGLHNDITCSEMQCQTVRRGNKFCSFNIGTVNLFHSFSSYWLPLRAVNSHSEHTLYMYVYARRKTPNRELKHLSLIYRGNVLIPKKMRTLGAVTEVLKNLSW